MFQKIKKLPLLLILAILLAIGSSGFAFYQHKELQHFKDAGYEKVDEVYPGLLAYVLYYNPDAFPALNIGGGSLVRLLFCLDRLFWTTWVGRKMSFATMSLWRRL